MACHCASPVVRELLPFELVNRAVVEGVQVGPPVRLCVRAGGEMLHLEADGFQGVAPFEGSIVSIVCIEAGVLRLKEVA